MVRYIFQLFLSLKITSLFAFVHHVKDRFLRIAS